jgi:hypothetical protein
MRDALFDQLTIRPDMFRYEMINILYDGFGLEVSPTTISRTLKTERWSRKTNGRGRQGMIPTTDFRASHSSLVQAN